jgi:AraC-like DNA-binding protein
VLVRVLVDAVERVGIAREELLAGRLDADWLVDPGVRVDLAEYAVLQARAIQLTGDEALGLHVVEQASESSFDVMAPLIAHAPTMREGIALCTEFTRLLKDEGHLTLRERGDVATIRYDCVPRSPVSDRMDADFVLSGLLRMVRAFGGPKAKVLAACFEYARPKEHREYTRMFGGAERFGHAFTGLSFPRDLLDRPQLHRHRELSAVLRLQAERDLSRISGGIDDAERLRQYLMVQRPSRMPDMKTAARDMGVSARSLRRKLGQKGLSYRAIVQSVREALAAQMLGDPNKTIQEVAHALGFSDAPAFHRAFKRWKGATPGTFQKVRGA